MDMMAPPETLSSISKLVASSPTPAAISHELSLLHQRTSSLLSLQQTLRAFSTRREGLTSLQASYSEVVERAIAEEEGKTNSTSPPSDSSQGGGRRLGVKDTEIRFRDAYADALDTFERGWEGQSQVFAQWELLPSLVMVESPPRPTFDAPPLPPSNFAIPNSWIYALPDPLNSTPSILRFTSLLLAEPYILGSGISTLEGPSLTSLLPPNNPTSTSSSSQHRASPLKTLFQLSAETRGPLAVLEIAHGIWSTALSELVGREKSDREEGGNGGGERVKELENFLVGVLDVLDSLGLEVEVDGGTGAANSQHDASSGGSGPLGLHRGVEEVLLQLLKDAPTVRANSKSEPETPSPPPSTWGSTVTSTFSTLINTSTSGLYSVASISGAGLSTVANAASMGFLPLASVTPPPPSPSPSPNPIPAPSKSIIASPNVQNRASSISTPSKILHPALLSQDPLAVLLSRSATSLLKLFTPSPRDSSATPKPLIEVLLSRLLSHSFPSNTSPSENRKVLLLGLIRWWCFSFLGRKIGQAGSGGGWTTPHIPFGVVLDGEGGIDFGAGKREETLLDEVHVGRKDAVELFLGLHRVVYAAMVDACGFGTSKEVGADRESRALAKAARSLVAAWSSGGTPASPPKPTKEIHAFLLGPGGFSTLVLSFGPLILRSHVPTLPKRNGGAGGARPISVSPSFKRSPAFVNRESKRVNPGVGARYSLDRQDEEEGMDEMLSDQLDIVLADVFSLSNRGQALLFAIPPDGSSSSLQITTRIPDDHLFHSPPPPAAPASSNFPSRLPPNSSFAFPNPPSNSNNFNKGWDSPPGSPRQEALQSSLQDQGSNFSQRPIQQQGIDIPEDDIPPFSNLLGTSLLWRSTSNPKATPQQAPARPVLSSPEVALLRKGIFALIRSGYVATRQGETGSDVFQEGKSHLVIDCLTSAARRSAEERQYHSHLLYSQCLSILRHHQIVGGTNMDFVLNRVAAPLRESYDKSCAILLRTQRRLDEIEGQRRRLLDLARVLRGEIDDAVRIRAWYTSFKASNLGRQFRARLSEAISPNRSPEERERALKKVENWQRELGIYSFARATDSPFEHALMLVETVVHLAIRPQVFYSNPLWSREKAVVDSLVAVSRSNQQRHAQDYRPSFAETLIGAGSAILTAPLSLAGLPYSSSTNPPASTSPLPRNVMLSFGASSPSMLKPHEQNTAFSGAVEEHLLRIGLKLSVSSNPRIILVGVYQPLLVSFFSGVPLVRHFLNFHPEPRRRRSFSGVRFLDRRILFPSLASRSPSVVRNSAGRESSPESLHSHHPASAPLLQETTRSIHPPPFPERQNSRLVGTRIGSDGRIGVAFFRPF